MPVWRATARIAAAAAFMAWSGFALAQTVPPAVQPGRIPQQFQPQQAPQQAPQFSVPAAPSNAPPAGAANVKMTLDSVDVTGATVYSPADFAPLVAPYLHHQIALTDLFKLADAITAKYRADGYILSRAVVPAQRIGKTAKIAVVEGFVSDVHVQGYDSARLQYYGRKIMDSRPLRAADLERYLLLANDLSGVTAHAVLAPSPNVEGGAVLTIVIEHKSWDAEFAVDNRGSKYIGPFQFYAGGGINIPGTDERIAARYITTPSVRELQFGEASFTQPIGDNGLRFVLYGNYTHSRPQYTLTPFNESSEGEQVSAMLNYPVLRSRDQNLEVHGGFAVTDLYVRVANNPSVSPSSDDHLRMFRTGANYDIADAWDGVNQVIVEFTKGLSVLGASANMSRATPSRPNAKSDFEKYTGQISRQQDLPFIYPGISLYTAFEAQLATDGPLPSSEQFGLGGPVWGRGYDPSDVVGDEGWAGRAELQYTGTPPGKFLSWWQSYQPYVFYDQGRVGNHVATTGDPSLASAGFGLRLAMVDHVTSDLEFAKPLSRDESVSYGKPDTRPWRFFMQVAAHF
ncbi:MAG: ShlB/FhaC/HecB family hemolysin secretion/activation protein [Alphaproteobacteria bacterium]|nr:ShlB/FhaC/HecB family hemolysin secretion/activation protein [Alphaproteobacteria bacterium]